MRNHPAFFRRVRKIRFVAPQALQRPDPELVSLKTVFALFFCKSFADPAFFVAWGNAAALIGTLATAASAAFKDGTHEAKVIGHQRALVDAAVKLTTIGYVYLPEL